MLEQNYTPDRDECETAQDFGISSEIGSGLLADGDTDRGNDGGDTADLQTGDEDVDVEEASVTPTAVASMLVARAVTASRAEPGRLTRTSTASSGLARNACHNIWPPTIPSRTNATQWSTAAIHALSANPTAQWEIRCFAKRSRDSHREARNALIIRGCDCERFDGPS